MSLLITTMLRIVWSSHKELKSDRVIISVKIALSIKKVDSIESVIAPTFTNLKLRSKLPDNLCPGISMVDHLDSVLILLGL